MVSGELSAREERGPRRRRTVPAGLLAVLAGLVWAGVSALAAAQEPALSLVEAINSTLENSPGVKIEKEVVRQKEGLLQTATGQFDLVAVAGASRGTTHLPASSAQMAAQADSEANKQALAKLMGLPPPTPSPILSTYRDDTDTYYLGLSQQMRNGIVITPMISTRSLQNNYDQPDMVNYSDVSLRITVPLLRGLGVDATGAEEMAARASLDAGLLAYKQNVARRVQDTVVAYWQCLGARQTMEITDSTRSRADQVFEMVGKLIKGGELAPNTLNEARAKLFSRDAEMESVRLLLYQRRQSLALAMGQGPGRMTEPPQAQGPFPVPPAPERLAALDARALVQASLERRRDYLALKQEAEAARILYGRALNYLQPDLKLALRAGYAGLSESSGFDRYYGSLSEDMRGLNFLSSLVLELPIQNNAARGEVVRRKALLEEVRLRSDDLAQAIASEVLVALEALRRSTSELEFAGQAEENYRVAVDVATQRLKLGEGSLTALIDQEDRYFQARILRNNASQRYAVALVQLRQATGTLFEDKGEDLIIHPRLMTQVPFLQ